MTYDTPPGVPPKPPQAPSGPSRLLPIMGAALGLLGLIVSVAAWFRSAPESTVANPVYSAQQVNGAQKAICETFVRGQQSLRAAGSRRPENPADPFPITAVNIRVAEVAVGNSLLNSTDANPAAPSELKDLANRLGNIYQDIALIQLADGQKADFNPLILQADEIVQEFQKTCQ